MEVASGSVVRQAIDFGAGRRALMVAPPPGFAPNRMLSALGLTAPQPLLLVFGGADHMEESTEAHIVTLFREVIFPAVVAARALIIDGGTRSGIMEIVGRVAAEQTERPPVLGVAPLGRVTYPGKAAQGENPDEVPLDPNHSHFVLTPTGEWGSETETMFALASTFALPRTTLSRPDSPAKDVMDMMGVMALLFNGGSIASKEAVQCVRHGWPLHVVQGTGRLADRIAEAKARLASAQEQENRPEEADLAEIIRSDQLFVVALTGEAEALAASLAEWTKQAGQAG